MPTKKVVKKSSKKVTKKSSKKVSKKQKGGGNSLIFYLYDINTNITRHALLGIKPIHTINIDDSKTIQNLYEEVCIKYNFATHETMNKCLGVLIDTFRLYNNQKIDSEGNITATRIIRNNTLISTVFNKTNSFNKMSAHNIFIEMPNGLGLYKHSSVFAI